MPAALASTAFTVGSTAVTYGAVLKFALAIGSVAYSRQQSKKAKRALKRMSDLAAEAQERKLTALDPIAPRRSIYGEVEVGGTIVFRHVNGDRNQFRHLVIVMADHEVAGFSNLKLDGELIPLNSSGEATGRFAGRLTAQYFLGTTSQGANAALLANCPEVWTSNHRLRRTAGVYIRMVYDPNLFPNSAPDFTVLCRGKKVFDPRTALTAWSNNAALCLLDYLTDTKLGMGLDYSSEINTAEVIASANNCDELVELDDATFEKRYTINGAVTTDTVYQDVIDDMVEAMAGFCTNIAGRWLIVSGYYRTPTLAAFTLADARAGYSAQFKIPRSENFNAVKGTFISPESYWQAADFPPITNSTYETQDGNERIFRDVQFPFTTSSATCQRLAKIKLEKNRQGITVNWPGKLTCFRAQAGDVVPLTIEELGWEDKPFEVVDAEFVMEASGEIGFDMVLRETASSVYDWNDGEETVADPSPDTNLPSPFGVEPPTDIEVLSDNTTRLEVLSGDFVPRIRVTWTKPEDEFVQRAGVIQMQYKRVSEADWITTPEMRGDEEITYIQNPIEAQAYIVRIRSKNRMGLESPWVYSDPTTSTGDTTPPDEPEDLAASGGIGGIYFEWSNPVDSDFDHTEFYQHTATTPAPTSGSTAYATIAGPGESYFLGGLSGGDIRYGWVRAVDTSGNKSDWVGPVGATVAVELTAEAIPGESIGSGSASEGTVTGNSVTAVPTGGVSPFSYLWEYVSGDLPGSPPAANVNISGSTAATASFSSNFTSLEDTTYSAIYRCKVTDSAATVVYTQDVSVSIFREGIDP